MISLNDVAFNIIQLMFLFRGVVISALCCLVSCINLLA